MTSSVRASWRRWSCALVLGVLSAAPAHAQTSSPWTGVIRDDAEPAAGAFAGYSRVLPHGLSADGRHLVFDSDRTLVEGDANGAYDVFLRDRQTGAMTRVRVATDGAEGNAHSMAAAISSASSWAGTHSTRPGAGLSAGVISASGVSSFSENSAHVTRRRLRLSW